MKLYTLSTFECNGYTTANWFFATSREEAEQLTEEAVNNVINAKEKLRRKDELWAELWKEYNDKSEYSALCVKYNIKDEAYSANILKLKCKKEYDEYVNQKNTIRQEIQSRLSWRMLCKIDNYYTKIYREELLYESIDELKNRIVEIDANKVLPLIQ